MTTQVRDSRGHLSVWQRAAIAPLWIALSVLMGFIVAVMSREHASVGFIIVGVVVGISGAVSYLLLPWCPPFRRLSALGRLVTSAVTAALPTVAFGAYAAFSKSAPLDVASLLNFTSIAMGFASISAMLVARVESWWGA